MAILIVCRGPIRQEALDVFREMGVKKSGILLSEKDAITYPRALAPELRRLDPSCVHSIADYTGATKEERGARIAQIIQIAKTHGYNYVFAGYGFMAEDEAFVLALEKAGLGFVGPGSHTVHAAGFKDEAKRTAEKVNVSVTPGVNNATARLMVQKHETKEALLGVARAHNLELPDSALQLDALEEVADAVLAAAYASGVDLHSVSELAEQLSREVANIHEAYPGRRIRLKAIGGGGGKGQRIVSSAAETADKVREVLAEVKALGVGDNKNILAELNIETTRHNEIQLVGNGKWCMAMGGRDCSLQMHEQKLLEVSITQEALREAAKSERDNHREHHARVLEADAQVLQTMEEEAERFGAEVGLDSASTFECIVDGNDHFFMEVNTRIQVEHRVSELCYELKFANPDAPGESFIVSSIVELMVLLARHGERLPRPERIRRFGAAVEARLNATDRSLSPSAGGEILFWSAPIEGEVRDDQGICFKNPDTGMFMRYKLAGAYDSNIALLVTTGDDRLQSYEKLREVLKNTVLRGIDLQTNLQFHYGVVHWFLAQGVYAKPTTAFVVPYLTLVGELLREAKNLDLEHAYQAVTQLQLSAETDADARRASLEILQRKTTLLLRPIRRLLRQPHLLSAWLSNQKDHFSVQDGRIVWSKNPLEVLAQTYELLNMEASVAAPAAHRIWDQDAKILSDGMEFYAAVVERLGGTPTWSDVKEALSADAPTAPFSPLPWHAVQGAHAGFQMGMDILGILPLIGERVGYTELAVNEDLTITLPQRLTEANHQAAMKKVLIPPPASKADEIVAASGGMYYGQEAPGMPRFVTEGQHFSVGDPLYVIEVMKMFNKVTATFSGTIDKILIDTDGAVVAKGQPLFKITPDERFVEEDPAQAKAQARANTDSYLPAITQK